VVTARPVGRVSDQRRWRGGAGSEWSRSRSDMASTSSGLMRSKWRMTVATGVDGCPVWNTARRCLALENAT
jgi:hypothetical protein